MLGYTETLGAPLLRREIAGLYETLEADDVIAVVGASEALFILFSALVRPGDHVVALWPAYQSLYDLARAQGAEVELVELRAEDGWALDLDRIAAAMRPDDARASSSTSRTTRRACTPSAAEFDALVELAERHGATLVCDEVYRGLEQDPADRLPAAADRSPRAVSVGVLSKSYALAGPARGLARDARPRAARRRRAGARLHLALQPGAVRGARHRSRCAPPARWLERSRGIIAANLPLVDELMAEHAERLDWVRPTAGSIGFPRYRGDRGHRRLQRAPRGRAGRAAAARARLRLRRRALPPRLRPPNLPEAVERLDRQLRA